MNNSSGHNIIYRFYLTLIGLTVAALAYCIALDANEYLARRDNRKILSSYLSRLNAGQTLKPKSPPPELDKMTKAQLEAVISEVDPKCVQGILDLNKSPFDCFISGTPNQLESLGVSRMSDFRSGPMLFYTYFGLALLALILTIKFWIVWLITGKRPTAFP